MEEREATGSWPLELLVERPFEAQDSDSDHSDHETVETRRTESQPGGRGCESPESSQHSEVITAAPDLAAQTETETEVELWDDEEGPEKSYKVVVKPAASRPARNCIFNCCGRPPDKFRLSITEITKFDENDVDTRTFEHEKHVEELEKLHTALKGLQKERPLAFIHAKLPKKPQEVLNTKNRDARGRQQELQKYLDKLCEHQEAKQSEPLLTFLDVPVWLHAPEESLVKRNRRLVAGHQEESPSHQQGGEEVDAVVLENDKSTASASKKTAKSQSIQSAKSAKTSPKSNMASEMSRANK